MSQDTIKITEKKDSIQIILDMTSIIPSINSIKQYEPTFTAKDVLNKQMYFQETLFEEIQEYYNELLFQAVESHKRGDEK